MKTYKLNQWIQVPLLSCCVALAGLVFSSNATAAFELSPQVIEAQRTLHSHILKERLSAGLVSKSLQINDITWHYNEGGRSDKPTILLLHGLTGNRDHWNRVAQFLTPHYHVIIPDLPGNGETKVSEKFDVSVPNVTSQLRLFSEKLQIQEDLNVAGHSFGGSIATMYASQYPFDTKSLFLLNSAGIYRHANTIYSKDLTNFQQLVVSRPGELDHVIQQLMQNPPSIPFRVKHAAEKLLISESKQKKKFIEQLVNLTRIYTPDSFARLTRNIEAPTLILWGKQDKIINVEVANELQSLLKRAETPVILNNVGHMPILEADQLVAKHYLPFLAKTQNLKNPLADQLIPLN